VTKRTGSADVLEALGLRIDLTPDQARRSLEEVGGAFLFAPGGYPTFAKLAAVRKKLGAEGQRTVVNLLGPLLNPTRPEARLVGVFRREHVALFSEALEKMGCRRYLIACGVDGAGRAIGEFSAAGPTDFAFRRLDERATRREEAAFEASLEGLEVADAADSAEMLTEILAYVERGFGQEMVVENAARAAWIHGHAGTIEEARRMSAEAIAGGAAARKLEQWREFSRSL
jgi:anthranilate phosphoribosyltransferase